LAGSFRRSTTAIFDPIFFDFKSLIQGGKNNFFRTKEGNSPSKAPLKLSTLHL